MDIRPCYAEVDTSVLKENYLNIKNSTDKDLIVVVKANAYGHGLLSVSDLLINYGATTLAVATVEEALELRNKFKDVYILILGMVQDSQIEICILNNIAFPVSSLKNSQKISSIASNLNKNALVHFAIDTGMGRIGYFYHQKDNKILNEILSIQKLPFINLEGVFTHFASADDYNLDFMNTQYALFKDVVCNLQSLNVSLKYIHCQNSAAAFSLNDVVSTHVRVGISLYGYKPSEFVNTVPVTPCLNWICKITHIKKVPSGTPIGYNSTYITNRETIVATIPVGYADGLRRGLSNKGYLYYKNTPVPIIGNICMDQTMIDVTDVLDCSVGDEVFLISEEQNADFMADFLDTISYEILCGISSRVPRVYK